MPGAPTAARAACEPRHSATAAAATATATATATAIATATVLLYGLNRWAMCALQSQIQHHTTLPSPPAPALPSPHLPSLPPPPAGVHADITIIVFPYVAPFRLPCPYHPDPPPYPKPPDRSTTNLTHAWGPG